MTREDQPVRTAPAPCPCSCLAAQFDAGRLIFLIEASSILMSLRGNQHGHLYKSDPTYLKCRYPSCLLFLVTSVPIPTSSPFPTGQRHYSSGTSYAGTHAHHVIADHQIARPEKPTHVSHNFLLNRTSCILDEQPCMQTAIPGKPTPHAAYRTNCVSSFHNSNNNNFHHFQYDYSSLSPSALTTS